MKLSEVITARRERLTIQVFITSLIVGVICFALSFLVLLLIGLRVGFLKIILLGPPPDSEDWAETLWWIVIWVGSFSLSVLSSWAFFRYAKRLVFAK
jgi:hypothetical protein